MLIESLHARNLLSFGPRSQPVPLNPLNVLIGPNGSGKSNLISCLGLLQAAADQLDQAFEGGIADWLHKPYDDAPTATLEMIVRNGDKEPLRHRLEFGGVNGRFHLKDERIENKSPGSGHDRPYLYFGYRNGSPYLNIKEKERRLQLEEINPNRSIISQRNDPDLYPALMKLAEDYKKIRIYPPWFSRELRKVQPVDLHRDSLAADGRNLPVVLNQMLLNPKVRKTLEARMEDFVEGFCRLNIELLGSYCQVQLEEVSGRLIPASRLSDGTLRYLCLLVILMQPDPPPLICIEEPELGLHPDIIPSLAELLREASEHTQVVVTTHSVALVDALTDYPESVLICEQEEGTTQMERLEKEALKTWLEKYSLGTLWTKGELGGNRW